MFEKYKDNYKYLSKTNFFKEDWQFTAVEFGFLMVAMPITLPQEKFKFWKSWKHNSNLCQNIKTHINICMQFRAKGTITARAEIVLSAKHSVEL